MFKFYVKLGENGYPTDTPVTETADGLVEFVAYTTTDKEYFLRYYSHYRQDNNGNWVAPDNLPSLQVSSLLRSIQDQGQIIADQKATITEVTTKLQTAGDTISTLQSLTGSLTGQVAQANQTIATLQTMAGSLTGQIAQLKLAQEAK